MALSSFIIRLLFLALPGIIAFKVYRKLRGKTGKQQWEDVLEIAIFSILSYALAAILHWVIDWLFRSTPMTQPATLPTSFFSSINSMASQTFSPFLDEHAPFQWTEIFLSTLMGVVVAIVASALHKYRCLNLLGQKMKASQRFGDDDVWEQFLSRYTNKKWLWVRDHKLNLLYFGAIKLFSDSEKARELVLEDVGVYDNVAPAEPIYCVKFMYVCREGKDLTIEIPDFDTLQSTGLDTNTAPEAPEEEIDDAAGEL